MIKNTSKLEKNIHWLFGGNPNAIERQEKEGQDQLVQSSIEKTQQLPINGNGCDALEIYKLFGFEVLGKSEGDDIFYDVKMPEGWRIEPTNHSMWSNLVDPNGGKRASIFYKAAFYDRSSFINRLNTKYTVDRKFFKRIKEDYYENINATPIIFSVLENGEEIHATDEAFFKEVYVKENHSQWHDNYDAFKIVVKMEAMDWVSNKFPNWEDPLAYWG